MRKHKQLSLIHIYQLAELTEGLLMDARASINNKKVLSVPVAELSTLGAGVSSLIPAFNTVTQTTSIAVNGLRCV